MKINKRIEKSLRHVVTNKIDCDVGRSEFELKLHKYVYFRTNTDAKGMNLLITAPNVRLNSTISVLLQGWLWHQMTFEG